MKAAGQKPRQIRHLQARCVTLKPSKAAEYIQAWLNQAILIRRKPPAFKTGRKRSVFGRDHDDVAKFFYRTPARDFAIDVMVLVGGRCADIVADVGVTASICVPRCRSAGNRRTRKPTGLRATIKGLCLTQLLKIFFSRTQTVGGEALRFI